MPRTGDVGLYRRLITAQRDGAPATAPPASGGRSRPDRPVADRFADVVAAMVAVDAGLRAGEEPLTVTEAAVDGDLSVVLVVSGDLDAACARQGAAGYARLLVRAGAAAEAGRCAATAAGFTARIDHTAGRTPSPAPPTATLTPLCTVVLGTPIEAPDA
jgi:hypothetical protein